MGKMGYIDHLVRQEDYEELSLEVGSKYAKKLISEYRKQYLPKEEEK